MSTFERATEQRRDTSSHVRRPGSDGEHLVQRRLGTEGRADRFYADQVLDRLNPRMREFLSRQEMFFLATADRHGECDNTFRAGPPGFLHVLDESTLAYPEYRGNGVHASLGNIEENPHVGVLAVDFLRDRIGLHVNGRARIVDDPEMRRARPELATDPVPGRRALVWVRITVEEAYIHCAKHIPHLQKAPRHGSGRSWGTDDFRRKGGDFFGAAAEAPRRDTFRPPPRADATAWRAEAEKLLARVERPEAEAGAEAGAGTGVGADTNTDGGTVEEPRVFSGWFSRGAPVG
ncbi:MULTISPECIES: pyridoxamine 5'-phosphate oxidase family protein [unclassified Streptomyces]|uniref:pyridoxamine 5'-phosphate oxidase family protein n=1 Tax=unclassified Streptomyces TaxID=2593676 RepID=UPI003450AA70